MDATIIRARPLAALIVGATGRNVLRVVTAFERRRILTVRAEDIASACQRIPVEMPNVVLVLVPPANDDERDALADHSMAVGALVVHVDPHLEDATFNHILEHTVQAAVERKLLREAAEGQSRAPGAVDVLASDDLDDGWED